MFFSGLSLTSLPAEISTLQTLSKQDEIVPGMLDTGTDLEPHLRLYLANNLFTRVPSPVLALQNLRVLSLRQNKLKSIPPTIINLVNLESLNVAGNLLTELPFEVIDLVQDHSLRKLTLHPNPWQEPPDDYKKSVHIDCGIFDPGKSGFFVFDVLAPTTHSGAVTRTVTTDNSKVPSLTEMTLRRLAKFDPQHNFDLKSLMPVSSPETVLKHLDLLYQQPGRRCTSCSRPIVLAEEEWLEWWGFYPHEMPALATDRVPYRRLLCRRGCRGQT